MSNNTELFLVLAGHDYFNEVQTISQVFYPNMKYIRTQETSQDGITIKSILKGNLCSALIYENGQIRLSKEYLCTSAEKKHIKNSIKTCIFILLKEYTGYKPQWGILTGIRPAKLARELKSKGMGRDKVLACLENDYLLAKDKARLAVTVCENELNILNSYQSSSPCIYVGIPFCPSKCLYCSFTSYALSKYEDKADLYLDCLLKEIKELPEFAPTAIYIGGGTPTSLNPKRLDKLLTGIGERFKVHCTEYTVEAGRPDTITEEKLDVMKKNGVNRLSINPQTMNDKTLALIGRNHSARQIKEAFLLARSSGFNNINMDLILGLPGETPAMVAETLNEIKSLNPESITVHTLAIKRASRLKESLDKTSLTNRDVIQEMIKISENRLTEMGMEPYYMYRQKNMLGNFENIGYCKKGFHSLYNVIIMEETQTVYAAGAGGVTKIVEGEKISRVFNVKDVDEYINRKSITLD